MFGAFWSEHVGFSNDLETEIWNIYSKIYYKNTINKNTLKYNFLAQKKQNIHYFMQ